MIDASTATPRGKTPVQMLEALDLIGEMAHGEKEKLSWARIEAFERRELAFDGLHLGQTDLPIGRLLDLLENEPALLPPRTGHMGNWTDIVNGRAGAMDFNRASTIRGRGYPLIYAFTQTEDVALSQGDWVYMPGSFVEAGQRAVLDLRVWNGRQFERCDRTSPRFLPFVMAEVEDGLRPLTQVQWRRIQGLGGLSFGLEARVLMEDERLVRDMLAAAIEDASAQTNARAAFQDVISHQVSIDGRMSREDVERVGKGYRIGAVDYPDLDALVDAAMLPLRAVAEPEAFFAGIDAIPTDMPLMASTLTRIVLGMRHSHYPHARIDRDTMTRPFSPHFHWGARDMAGYPPVRGGYFLSRNRIKGLARISQAILDRTPQADPLLFLMMPVVIFMLCPTSAHEDDARLVEDLIASIRRTVGQGRTARAQMPETRAVVGEWLQSVEGRISDYFLDRFHRRRSVLHRGALPAYSDPVEPQGFREMTMRQACMTVGALVEALTDEDQLAVA